MDRRLHQTCLELWHSTDPAFPTLGPRVPWYRQWRNARAATALVGEVAARLPDYPIADDQRSAWRSALRRRLVAFGEERLAWPAAYRDAVFDDGFFQTAAAFADEARRFDRALPLEDLGQALRNVWVGNSLQILAGLPVRLTPALFAYSMLYPATDNVLDAPNMSSGAKQRFNEHLGRRLAGESIAARDPDERRVWALLDTIEGEFPRCRYPGVWQSLIDIHRAQHASLRQHRTRLPERELLDLTVAKGGASVRADAYVIAGKPDPQLEQLAFLYGVFLQMLDDLQDIGSDREAGHETLFTRAARTGELDRLTCRLAHFIDRVLAPYAAGAPGTSATCVEVIRRNCLTLIVGVIAREPRWFGWRLRRDVERQWPIGLRATRRLLGRAQQQLGQARVQIQKQHGTDSVLELLLERA